VHVHHIEVFIGRLLKHVEILRSLSFNFMAIEVVHLLKQCQKNQK